MKTLVIILIIFFTSIIIGALFFHITPTSLSNFIFRSQISNTTGTVTVGDISINAPRPNDIVGPKFTIKGFTKTSDKLLIIRITNTRTQNVYFEGPANTNIVFSGKYSDFSLDISFSDAAISDAQEDDNLTLEAFLRSQNNPQEETDKLTIPLVYHTTTQ